jgi:hypothetical protein
VYRVVLGAQIVAYLIALAGLLPNVASRSRIASAAASFVVLNAAAWRAFWVWAGGGAEASWKKVAYRPADRQSDSEGRLRSGDVSLATPPR